MSVSSMGASARTKKSAGARSSRTTDVAAVLISVQRALREIAVAIDDVVEGVTSPKTLIGGHGSRDGRRAGEANDAPDRAVGSRQADAHTSAPLPGGENDRGPVKPRVRVTSNSTGSARDGDQRMTIAALCLQPFQLHVNDVPVTRWNGLRSLQLMLVLLSHHPTPVPKDVLIETFWPDIEPSLARHRLHQEMYRLRQTLRRAAHDACVITYERDRYGIHQHVDMWTDAKEFECLVEAGDRALEVEDTREAMRSYHSAETLYHDDYLPDHLYDDWCRPKREALRQRYIAMVEFLADHHLECGDYARVIELSQRLLARDPTNETGYQRLMRSHLALGHRHLAAAEFHRCTTVLQRELQLEPSGETMRLVAQVQGT